MLLVENEDSPNLETYLCYRCGFHPNRTLMGDRALYVAYQAFFSNYKDILQPEIRRNFTGGISLKNRRRLDRVLEIGLNSGV